MTTIHVHTVINTLTAHCSNIAVRITHDAMVIIVPCCKHLVVTEGILKKQILAITSFYMFYLTLLQILAKQLLLLLSHYAYSLHILVSPDHRQHRLYISCIAITTVIMFYVINLITVIFSTIFIIKIFMTHLVYLTLWKQCNIFVQMPFSTAMSTMSTRHVKEYLFTYFILFAIWQHCSRYCHGAVTQLNAALIYILKYDSSHNSCD